MNETEQHIEAEAPDAPSRVGSDSAHPTRDDKVSRMGTESIPRLITEFAIPSIVGMLVGAAYNIVDSIFLGQAMGPTGLAITTAAMPIMIIFMAIAMLIGNGGNALTALRLGEGDREGAEVTLGNTTTLTILVSALVAVVAFIEPCINCLLSISGTTPEVWDATKQFVQILSAGFILQCFGFGVNNFIRTAGSPNIALGTNAIGTLVCIVANYLFVMVMRLGTVGSACATLTGQAVTAVLVLLYFTVKKNVPLRLHARFMPLKGRVVHLILSLGFASFAVQAAAAVVNFVLNNLLVKYGALTPMGAEEALASIGVVQRVAMVAVMPLVGVAIAIQPLLGFNYGAHLFARVRTTLKDGIAGATAISIFMWAIVHLFPNQIVAAFGIADPNLVDFTVFALKVQLMLLPFVGFQIVGSNYFQATGQPMKSAFLSLTRQVLFLIPLYLWLPTVLPVWFPQLTGLDALYFAVPVADFLAIFTTILFMVHESRRMGRIERGELEATF